MSSFSSTDHIIGVSVVQQPDGFYEVIVKRRRTNNTLEAISAGGETTAIVPRAEHEDTSTVELRTLDRDQADMAAGRYLEHE